MSLHHILGILEIIITSHLLLLGIYLFFEKNRRNIGVKYLGLFLFIFGIHYLFISLSGHESFKSNGIIQSWFNLKLWVFMSFSFGPMLLITTQAYVFEKFSLSKKDLLHLLVFLIPLFHYLNPELLEEKTINDWTYLGVCTEIHNLSYSSISLFLTLSLKRDEFRNYKRLLLHVNCTYFIVVISWITFEFVRYHGWSNSTLVEVVFLILLAFFVDGLIIICWKYPDTIINSKYIRSRLKEWVSEKYQDSRVEDNYAEKILSLLKRHVEAEKLYKISELKLASVSEKIGFPPKDISQVVNVYLSKSFNEYLNSLRIQEASILLTEQTDLNIMEVMYQTGFNSKSLFFKYFKEEYGITPALYKKRMNNVEI